MSINKRYSDISGEEGHFFQAISREIYEAAKNPTQIIQDATKILDEQNFINQALNMSKGRPICNIFKTYDYREKVFCSTVRCF